MEKYISLSIRRQKGGNKESVRQGGNCSMPRQGIFAKTISPVSLARATAWMCSGE